MASYSFTCVYCKDPFQTTAQNAKYCQKRDCQKYRKDLGRKPKTSMVQPVDKTPVAKETKQVVAKVEKKQITKVVGKKPVKITKPEKIEAAKVVAKTEKTIVNKAPKKSTAQTPAKAVLKTNDNVSVERVDEHVVIIRMKGPIYIPDTIAQPED